ncbi:MAG: Re/Si-specific NAD(P)(+) transhydrogenase subunit alpha [Halobacteria archaeon]
MIVGVPREILPGETRVALAPESVAKLKGVQVAVERSAGEAAGFPDDAYQKAGASVAPDARSLYGQADLLLKVRPPTPDEASMLKEGSTLVSMLYPAANLETVKRLAARRVTAFALELMPRISRAQSMDVLSSQATVAGYKAVLMAADSLPRFFPLLMTAAGTISPARVFVIGAGVAGLQAIATAKRLGAVVCAYDLRPVVREQIESLGAKFVQLAVEAADAQDRGGYARAQSEEFYRKQQELLAKHVAEADAVITTALVPGQKAPTLVPEAGVRGMRPGSVVVDLAAEQGGNCPLTEPGKSVVKHGVTIHGLLNLPATLAPHASQMFSRNVVAFLLTFLKEGKLAVDDRDELVKGTMVVRDGQVIHEPTKKALGVA